MGRLNYSLTMSWLGLGLNKICESYGVWGPVTVGPAPFYGLMFSMFFIFYRIFTRRNPRRDSSGRST